MGTNKRHLLVLAIAIASLQLHVSSLECFAQLHFVDAQVAPSNSGADQTAGSAPVAPPDFEEWLLGEAQPGGRKIDMSEVVAAQFSEVESVTPGALDEASLPNPSAATTSTENLPLTSEVIHGDEALSNATPLGEVQMAPMSTDYVEQMEVDNTVHFSSHANYRRGYWYSQQDVVMMLRTEVQDLLMSFDDVLGADPFTGFLEDMSIGDAGFSYEPGLRITVGKMLGQDVANRDYAFEFSYLGLFEYEGSAAIGSEIGSSIRSALGQGRPRAGFNLPVDGFDGALRHTLDYQGDYDSLELNVRILGRPNRDRMALQPSGTWVRHATPSRIKTGLLGLRYISLNDYVQYRAHFQNPGQNRGNYLLRAQNDMFGMQVGGSVSEARASWAWGLNFKTSALINMVSRDSDVNGRTDGTSFARQQFLEDEHLAVAVDVGLNASYQIRQNIAIRSAYDFTYITGIAVASNNMDLAAEFSKLDLTGDAFLHGLSIGFEMMY